MNMQFDEETHTYTVDGRVIPSVSQKMRDVLDNGEPIPPYAIAAAHRGVVVHKIINFDLLKVLDYDTIDDQLKGYFESYKLFMEDAGLSVRNTERRLYHPYSDTCMTLDFEADNLKEKSIDLIDWKTGKIYPKYQVQLGWYAWGLISHGVRPQNIYCVQLFKDGKKGVKHQYDLDTAISDANAVSRVYNLKKLGGKLK